MDGKPNHRISDALKKRFWRKRFFEASLILVVLVFPGCRRADLVEAELRTRQQDIYEMKSELARTEAYNEALQREVGALRKGPSKLTPEQASQLYTIKSITLGRQTGGYDEDRTPGDEALQVVLQPIDGDGQSIKAPGTLRVEALEVTPEGLKKPLSFWTVTPEKLRPTWKSGFFSTGYYVILPWKIWPTMESLRVIVQFTLTDGRTFEAEKDVTIRLPPRKRPKIMPGEIIEGPEMIIPDSVVPLPPPRKIELEPEAAAHIMKPRVKAN